MAAEKCFTHRYMEPFGLKSPKHADRFVAIFNHLGKDGGAIG